MSLTLWNHRCEILHGVENKDKKALQKESLWQTITRYYNNKHIIDPIHQHIFREPLPQLITSRSINYLQNWIHSYHTAHRYTKRKKVRDYQLISLMDNLTLSASGKEKGRKKKRKKRNEDPFYFPEYKSRIKPPSYSARLASLRRQYKLAASRIPLR